MAYELMAVLNPKADTDATAKKIEKFIADSKATSVKVEKLGRKELAYPIKKQKEADYFLFYFDAVGDGIKGLADKIRLEQEAVLRYLVIATKAKEIAGKQKKVVQQEEEKKTKVTVKTVTVPKTAVKTKKTPAKKKETKVVKEGFVNR
ncbi:MAG: 30S ribosomal protein S6 [Candidatus Curtissbacteria bacterium GW2011_GWA1_40_16]|uniref:Small ribosomal subunit protein bS6 n=1 Tax=Candidatus Curtissbacteria bacterium GW2011_GWA1_40_16 TaxID=1618405 RepID=A0A0G0TSM6_9BACT|nr:MAG: 30S ribosomal protein S6 [Candidatus Curtissbacteria bacterium GW2011_GWA1_40_16]